MCVLLQDPASLTCTGPALHTYMCPDVHILTRTLTRTSCMCLFTHMPVDSPSWPASPGLCSLSTCAHSQLPRLPQVLPQSLSTEPVPCSAPWCPAWLWQGVGIESAGIKRDFSQFELCPSHCLQMQPCGHHIFTKCAKKKRCLARSCRAEEYQGGCARWQAWLLQPLMGAPARAASAREKLAGMAAWAGGAGGLVGYNLLPGWASPTPRPHSPDLPRGGAPCGASFLFSFLS